MKKYVIKISLAFVIIAALVLIMLWLRSIDGDGTAPSYRFLEGRNPITCEKRRTPNEDMYYIYSFEADFNGLCSKADTELIGAGFVGKNLTGKSLSGNDYVTRYYWLKNRFPRGPVWININNHLQYTNLHDLDKNTPKSMHYELAEKDGWVMIEVVYGRGWQWPF